MIFNLYAIKDELSEFATPIAHKDDDNAKRWFREIVKESPMMKSNPKDFSIWMNGRYNAETGEISPTMPKLLERADSFTKKEE